MTLFANLGSEDQELSAAELEEDLLRGLRALGPRQRVLVVPSDFTRLPPDRFRDKAHDA
jgi:hypothetical protein